MSYKEIRKCQNNNFLIKANVYAVHDNNDKKKQFL